MHRISYKRKRLLFSLKQGEILFPSHNRQHNLPRQEVLYSTFTLLSTLLGKFHTYCTTEWRNETQPID
jgi:hypothetical protein